MEKKILEICENLCCKELSAKEQLIITGLFDSFKIMELITSLEEEFQITFLPEDITNLDNFSCIDSILALVERKLGDKE